MSVNQRTERTEEGLLLAEHNLSIVSDYRSFKYGLDPETFSRAASERNIKFSDKVMNSYCDEFWFGLSFDTYYTRALAKSIDNYLCDERKMIDRLYNWEHSNLIFYLKKICNVEDLDYWFFYFEEVRHAYENLQHDKEALTNYIKLFPLVELLDVYINSTKLFANPDSKIQLNLFITNNEHDENEEYENAFQVSSTNKVTINVCIGAPTISVYVITPKDDHYDFVLIDSIATLDCTEDLSRLIAFFFKILNNDTLPQHNDISSSYNVILSQDYQQNVIKLKNLIDKLGFVKLSPMFQGESRIFRCFDKQKKQFIIKLKGKYGDFDGNFEIQILKQFNGHPGIVKMYYSDPCFEGSQSLIIMERLEVFTIEDETYESKIGYMKSLLQVLEHLHNHNILHNDIKLNNVMFRDRDQSVLIDFDLAEMIETQCTNKGGSRGYISPEKLKNLHYGKESDMYSVGILFAEWIYEIKFSDFGSESGDKIRQHIADEADRQINILTTKLILMLIDPNPSKRPSA
ncbi:serine/threonine-protein kinase, partial [Acrasis kona]